MIEDDSLIAALADAMGAGYHDALRASAELALAETPDGEDNQATRDGLAANASDHARRVMECRRAAEQMRPVLTATQRQLGEFEGAPIGEVVRRQIVATFPRYRVAGPVGRRELVWTERVEVCDDRGVGESVFLQYVYDAAHDTIRTGMVEPEG